MIRRSLSFALLCAAGAAFAQTPAPTPAPAQKPAAAPDPAAAPAPAAVAPLEPVHVIDPLQITDNKLATGAEASPGKNVLVHYTGRFYKQLALGGKGRKFDSSRDAGREPLSFTLGAGRVIKGWDQGLVGMKVGGKRTLIIPSHLAYGKAGAGGGSIPPDSALIFDVELLDVK
jgi:FKBP-type peptidyl-prolyl cis-trans isomerase FkpA